MKATQTFSKDETVLQAAQRRMRFIFDQFESIIVSVSGGKDSLVVAHLALVEAHKRKRKIGIHLLDEEVIYQSTVDEVDYIVNLYPENTTDLWLQVPFNLTNATSFAESQLQCWEPGKHKDWMRRRRQGSIQHPPWDVATQTVGNKAKGFGFYDVIDNFERCYENTAFLVGLRASGESLDRWRTMVKNPVLVGGQNVYWATKKEKNTILYPVFDWDFHDIWKYIYDEKLKYSKVYDWQFKKGMPVHRMRVSSLIHEKAFKSICDLPEFEPKTYQRLCHRVKGIQLTQELGKTDKMFRCSKLPKNFKSWRTYRDFLLQTYPKPEHRLIFVNRFKKHLDNEYVARQQCRQLVLTDYENNLSIDNKPDPRDELIRYYEENL